MEEIEKIVKELFGRKTDHDYRYDYRSLSPEVMGWLVSGDELGRDSFEAQVYKLLNREERLEDNESSRND